MTPAEVLWQVIRVTAIILWVAVRICLAIIIGVVIGSIKGAGKAQRSANSTSRD